MNKTLIALALEPKIYSYQRVSSTSQLDGKGLELQSDAAILQRLSQEHNLPISEETMSDAGKSAYHGEHLKHELGAFISAIKAGEVAEGSILVVYSLDRLSRLQLGYAKQIYLDLTNNGISIFSMADNYLYRAHTPADDILSTIVFERAHNESKTKSKRVLGTAQTKIEDFMKGIRSSDGFPISIGVGRHPIHIDASKKDIRPHPYYFDMMKKMTELLADGWGISRITEYLNDNWKAPNGRPVWNRTVVARLCAHPSLYGRLEITVDGKEYSLDDYYPALITADQWRTIQRAKSSRKRERHTVQAVAVLGGLMKCGRCGGAIKIHYDSRGNYLSYACLRNAQKGNCSGIGSMTAKHVDRAVVQILSDVVWSQSQNRPESNSIANLTDDIRAMENHLAELTEGVLDGSLPRSMWGKLNQLEDDIKTKKVELREAEIKLPPSSLTFELEEQWRQDWYEVVDNYKDEANRLKLKQLLSESLSHIQVLKDLGETDFFIEAILINGEKRYVHANKERVINCTLTKPEHEQLMKNILDDMLASRSS